MNRALGLLLLLFLGRFVQPVPQEKAGVWLDVPFVLQSEDGCGSAAISMVLQYWNAHGVRMSAASARCGSIRTPWAFQYCRTMEIAADPQPSSLCFTNGTSSHTPAFSWGAG